MIKVGIIGADDPQAGELIRLLLHHPDVVLKQLYAPNYAERYVNSVHHGLIGECTAKFTDSIDVSSLDVLFLTTDDELQRSLVPGVDEYPDLRVIDIAGSLDKARIYDALVVYGVPEMNRKPLVRGARRAVIPSAVETIASIAFLPLAMHSMLPETLDIIIDANDKSAAENTDGIAHLAQALKLNGNDVAPSINIEYHNTLHSRAMRVSTKLDVALPLDNIVEMYENLYDDHNLTHIVGESVSEREVVGTDKCIVSLYKSDEGELCIEAIADARLRGGAGDAVHVMNLLMGLYEKTGLELKAAIF